MTRRATAIAATLLAVLAFAGCESGHGEPREAVQTRFLERLSAAITDLNTARQHLADDAAAISLAAERLDDVDAVAVRGDRTAVRGRRPAAAAAVSKAAAAARRLGKDVTTYDRAVAALGAAGDEGLDATQQAAVQGVVTAGRDELGQLHSYATVIATVWPRYESLDENQLLWLARASNGWYRNQDEAANAYVVLTERAGLTAARRSLSSADAARLRAARSAAAAIRTARDALAVLLG